MRDGFSIIQQFFTRMRCNACDAFLEPEGVQLIRHERDVFVVNIHCVQCSQQMGVALVGLEGVEMAPKREADPEFTETDRERLGRYSTIGYDDVLEAHEFFTSLDADWTKHLPEEMRQREITLEPECEVS